MLEYWSKAAGAATASETMATQRTDIHRPSAINPDDYDYVATLGDNEGGCGRQEMEAFNAHRLRTGGRMSDHAHGGSCHVCGALAFYRVIWFHRPSNTYIATGYDCAEKLGGGDADVFRRLKDEVARAKKAKAGKAKAQLILKELGMERAWEIAQLDWSPHNRQRPIIKDLVGKLIKYGDLSEKQIAFLGKLVEQHDHWENNKEKIEAERQAEKEAAEPIPFDNVRGTIKGKVLSVKQVDSDFGMMTKILVVADEGWKVYGSAPSSLLREGLERGCFVKFDAKVTVSKDDAKFGFFSRPTKAALISS